MTYRIKATEQKAMGAAFNESMSARLDALTETQELVYAQERSNGASIHVALSIAEMPGYGLPSKGKS